MLPMNAYVGLKDLIGSDAPVARRLARALGLIIFFVGAALLRGPRRFEMAFLGLLVLCVTGEVIDAATAWHNVRGPNWLGGAKDIVNTMFWPSIWLFGWPHVVRMLRVESVPPDSAVPRPRAGEGCRRGCQLTRPCRGPWARQGIDRCRAGGMHYHPPPWQSDSRHPAPAPQARWLQCRSLPDKERS